MCIRDRVSINFCSFLDFFTALEPYCRIVLCRHSLLSLSSLTDDVQTSTSKPELRAKSANWSMNPAFLSFGATMMGITSILYVRDVVTVSKESNKRIKWQTMNRSTWLAMNLHLYSSEKIDYH